jgi:GAF domain-containing protein
MSLTTSLRPPDDSGEIPVSLEPSGAQDAGRLAAVRRYEALDAPADGAFDRFARLAATIFRTPIATVSIVDENRVWFAASTGLDGVREIGAEPGLCASAILQDEPYIVIDAATDPRTLHHPLVRGELGLRFYAAAPIITAEGHRLGTVNVIDVEPRPEVGGGEQKMLVELAGAVADLLDTKLAALDALRAERRALSEENARVQEAAALAARMSAAAAGQNALTRPAACELGGSDPCTAAPELKIADSWGDSAWGCFAHAEEALINLSSVFLASETTTGVAAYRARRTRPL